MNSNEILTRLKAVTDPLSLLRTASEYFGNDLVLASSLGAEDQVLTHMFLSVCSNARIFVLDTGRLPQETYDTMEAIMQRYHMQYEVCTPPQTELQNMLSNKGPNSFYHSVENRKECCHIRKVLPLQQKLSTAKAWITGLRQGQSEHRSTIPQVLWDETHALIKLNPLVFWSTEAVWDYIKTHAIPYNKLHDKGFPSIGCASCTRAIRPGEPIRAGRWWWEDPKNNECGLHVRRNDGPSRST